MSSVTIALCIVSMILLFFFITICRILYSIFSPTIIPYPYPPPPSSSRPIKEWTVVFAGSFNPIHMGHLAMIEEYIIHHYSKVLIVIGTNPNKLYDVSAQQRANLIRKVIRHSKNKFFIQNCIVQVVSNDYVWRIVQRQGATMFVRGIRTWEQDGRDERKLQFQNMYGPIVLGPLWYPMPTIFIQGMPQYNHVSSTYLRNLIQQYTRTTNSLLFTDGTTSIDDEEEETSSEGIGNDSRLKQQQQQRQKDQLYQVLRQKLKLLVPESIVDDVIQLYGKDQGTGSWGISELVKKNKSI